MRLVLVSIVALASTFLGDCGRTQVRVLDDITGKPVAGATVVPFVIGGWDGVYQGSAVITDAEGVAVVKAGKRLSSLRVTHPELRQVHASDRPSRDGDVRLKYLRRPPQVTLLLPADFTGPVLVGFSSPGWHDPAEREPTYRVRMPDDVLAPISLPGVYAGEDLVKLDEVHAERAGEAVTPGNLGAKDKAVHIWVSRECTGTYYEDAYGQPVYIGTEDQFLRFEQALRKRLSGETTRVRLTRSEFREFGAAAANASQAK